MSRLLHGFLWSFVVDVASLKLPPYWWAPWSKSETHAAPKGAKNVVFIIYDDLRAMQTSYGWTQPHTPNHDRLMQESFTFDAAYVQQAVCGPSRASFLSGRRPDRTQVWNFMDGPAPGGFRNAPGAKKWNTLPQHFAKNGYYVAGAGKVYHAGDPKDFDPPSWTEPECKEAFPHSGQGTCPLSRDSWTEDLPGCPVDPKVYKNCTNGELDCFPDLVALQKGLGFLRKGAAKYKDHGQPFFLAIGFVKPHLPFIYPKEYLKMVPNAGNIELPPNPEYTVGAPSISWIADGFQGSAGGSDVIAPKTQSKAFIQGYYAAAAFTDDLLGQLLDEIDNLGLKQSTAVVVTSDNGYGLGEHNHWEKYTNFETDARVPLFVRVPWRPDTKGVRTQALVELIDLYPSLAELAGIPVDHGKESIDGKSWVHLLAHPTAEHKDAVFTQHPRCWEKAARREERKKHRSPNVQWSDDDFKGMNRCTYGGPGKFSYMGYSIRTPRWRYTEWAAWNEYSLAPDWDNLAATELYDHDGDTLNNSFKSFTQFENINVALSHETVAKSLGGQMHRFVDGERRRWKESF